MCLHASSAFDALHAGTTVTLVMVIGSLLTVANLGDSSAVLDTGCSILELTASHRIHSNEAERNRLESAGCQIASLGFHLQGPARPNETGVGPLRIWPGGLCVSRSIGDIDAGPEIVPVPHVKQVGCTELHGAAWGLAWRGRPRAGSPCAALSSWPLWAGFGSLIQLAKKSACPSCASLHAVLY